MVFITSRDVGATGFGLMSLTPPFGNPVPREQAFEAMNAALETGATFWNGGHFYGTPENNSLHLLRDYFTKYPENASKVVLSIKSGLTEQKTPDGSAGFINQCVSNCLEILPPSFKKIDIFQCARVDPNVPIEDTMRTLIGLVDAGKFGSIGLSEVGVDTIRRASKITPIAAVEVEFSLFETGILQNGVASVCAELDIPIVAYSPLGRGVLTGEVLNAGDLPLDSVLRRMDRFQGDNLEQNFRLIQELHRLSLEFKPYTMPNIALSWLRAQSQRKGLPQILPIAGTSKKANVRANALHVELSKDDIVRIDRLLQENKVVGPRSYAGQHSFTP
ncbi:NADP-dependent oxidoreductase domain-containing protein [Aspergillus keveii]|uniref:NADP-dependent oxidoreductase domain-containing protein n=1 Tax=Aspergillus keveii TaxID=714993 RepID=A0ABR4FS61_9EURO